MASDLDFDELDKAVSGYMQKRKRGPSQVPALTDGSSQLEQTPVPEKEVVADAPNRPAVSVLPKPQGHHSAPPIHLEPRRSLNYRDDIIHDIAPPRPLPPRTGRTLKPSSLSSRVSEDERPASRSEKVEVAHHDQRPHLSSLFGHGDHDEGHKVLARIEPPEEEDKPVSEPAKPPTDAMREGAISDALAEDLGKEKKAFETDETEAADKLSTAPAPEVDLPTATEIEEREEEVKAEAKPLHEPSKNETGSEPLDEPDRLLPEGPHSMASPSTPQVPREEADHSVDLFDTKQYHTPLSTAPSGKPKQQSSPLKWVLIIIICLAVIALGVYYYLAYVKK
ncbi:MAG TPA: hypothetical protein VGS28_03315 [Candidatus Saccharimonadales bacterium]|nr:hypothetical protein [Candidatus Saccharimonadales bacterium]